MKKSQQAEYQCHGKSVDILLIIIFAAS